MGNLFAVKRCDHPLMGLSETHLHLGNVPVDPTLVGYHLTQQVLRVAGDTGPVGERADRRKQVLVLAHQHAAPQTARAEVLAERPNKVHVITQGQRKLAPLVNFRSPNTESA